MSPFGAGQGALVSLVFLFHACGAVNKPGNDQPHADADAGATAVCPAEADFFSLNGTRCPTPRKECRKAECSNPCHECIVLVCQQVSGNGYRWELNSQVACPCEDTPPHCVDQVTCEKTPGCS